MERKKKQQEMRSEEWLNKMKEGRGRERGTKEYKCVRQGEKGRCQRESKERGQKREEVYDWMIRRGYNGLVGRRRKRPRLRGEGPECVADVEFGVLTRASSKREREGLTLAANNQKNRMSNAAKDYFHQAEKKKRPLVRCTLPVFLFSLTRKFPAVFPSNVRLRWLSTH